MSITKHLEARYSTKLFNPANKLNPEQVQHIKNIIRLSPSSTNIQPWHVLIASSEQSKKRIAKAVQGIYAFNEKKIFDASHVLVFCAKTDIDQPYLNSLLNKEVSDGLLASDEVKEYMRSIRSATVNAHRDMLQDLNHWIDKQIYLNIGTLLLGVATMGIDAVPMEGFDPKVLDEEFDLSKQGYRSVIIVSLGYRSDDDSHAKRPKSRLAEQQIFTEC